MRIIHETFINTRSQTSASSCNVTFIFTLHPSNILANVTHTHPAHANEHWTTQTRTVEPGGHKRCPRNLPTVETGRMRTGKKGIEIVISTHILLYKVPPRTRVLPDAETLRQIPRNFSDRSAHSLKMRPESSQMKQIDPTTSREWTR